MIRVLFFGPVVEHVDQREMHIEHRQDLRLEDVIEQLKSCYPKAFEIVCFTAVNEVQAQDTHILLADNDEIAFMAKYSGG